VIEDLAPDSINQALDTLLDSIWVRPGASNGHLLERNTLAHFKQTLQSAIQVSSARESRGSPALPAQAAIPGS
jgi:hypothetical protein